MILFRQDPRAEVPALVPLPHLPPQTDCSCWGHHHRVCSSPRAHHSHLHYEVDIDSQNRDLSIAMCSGQVSSTLSINQSTSSSLQPSVRLRRMYRVSSPSHTKVRPEQRTHITCGSNLQFQRLIPIGSIKHNYGRVKEKLSSLEIHTLQMRM